MGSGTREDQVGKGTRSRLLRNGLRGHSNRRHQGIFCCQGCRQGNRGNLHWLVVTWGVVKAICCLFPITLDVDLFPVFSRWICVYFLQFFSFRNESSVFFNLVIIDFFLFLVSLSFLPVLSSSFGFHLNILSRLNLLDWPLISKSFFHFAKFSGLHNILPVIACCFKCLCCSYCIYHFLWNHHICVEWFFVLIVQILPACIDQYYLFSDCEWRRFKTWPDSVPQRGVCYEVCYYLIYFSGLHAFSCDCESSDSLNCRAFSCLLDW